MISGNVPKHLTVGARTGFLVALKKYPADWKKVAMVCSLDGSAVDLVDLGAAPMPKSSKTGITIQDMIEKTIAVTPVDWDVTVWISQNAIDDDRTGSLLRRCRQAGENFNKHLNNRVFSVLNGGDGSTYGACYDGKDFFDNDHVDGGANYQTVQSNEGALTPTIDNFETTWVAAQGIRDDQGEYCLYNYDQPVVPPALYREMMQIVKNEWAYDTVNREINPYKGGLKEPIVSPQLDSTAWHLIASNETIKPLIVAMRKQPNLQHAWFDPKAPDGGRNYFKFFARYEVHYGDWRLAYQGNT